MRFSSAVTLAAPLYYGGLRALRVTALSRCLRDAGPILCYHNVVPADAALMGDRAVHVSVERFERQVQWLASHYTIVALEEFVERVIAGASLRSIAAITFDDGYAGVFEYAVPILRAAGVPATVFLVSGAPGAQDAFWWDWPDMGAAGTPAQRRVCLATLKGDARAIAAHFRVPECGRRSAHTHRAADWALIRCSVGCGIDIGAHSASHRCLTALTDEELDEEIGRCRARIADATGQRPKFFAYPYGSWDPRVRGWVRAAGFHAAVTLDPGVNRPRSDRWSLRRVNVPSGISAPALEAWAAGLGARSQ